MFTPDTPNLLRTGLFHLPRQLQLLVLRLPRLAILYTPAGQFGILPSKTRRSLPS